MTFRIILFAALFLCISVASEQWNAWNSDWQGWNYPMSDGWSTPRVEKVYVKTPVYVHKRETQYKVTRIARKVPKTTTHTVTTYEDDDHHDHHEPWITFNVNGRLRKPTIIFDGWAKDGKIGLNLNIH